MADKIEIDNATRMSLQQIADSLRKLTTQQADLLTYMRTIAHYFEQESQKKGK
jgi:hypothetical protein